jgi:threonine dehydrogenase-like Zn-dependent dehydrogenase
VSVTKEQVVAVVAKEDAKLVERDIPSQPLAADEICGRTLVSLISPGTELGGNYVGGTFPSYPGYAAVFEVADVGPGVKDIAPGDVVFCTGPNGTGGHHAWQRCPRAAVIPVPDGLAPEVAVHGRLMGVTMSTLVTTVARPPDFVLITGLGPIGHLGAQIFQSCGYRVIAVDPSELRRETALQKGLATVLPAIPVDDATLVGKVRMVVECSGHEQAVMDAARMLCKGGELVMVGVPRQKRAEIYAIELMERVFRGFIVLRSGSEWVVSRHGEDYRVGSVFGNLAAAMDWLKAGRVDIDGLYAMVSPKDCQRVYQDLLHQRTREFSMVFDWRAL